MQEIKIENNILTVDGKSVQLTEDQLKDLGIKGSPFDIQINDSYYFIMLDGGIGRLFHSNSTIGKNLLRVANACKDKELMKKRALHETLSRLLWKFSLENGGDEINWRKFSQEKWFIYYDPFWDEFNPDSSNKFKTNTTYFISEEVTQRAINEVLKPFIEENPEFEW